jgi:hypothetical protein
MVKHEPLIWALTAISAISFGYICIGEMSSIQYLLNIVLFLCVFVFTAKLVNDRYEK